jgi:hypothetical protein
MLTGFVHVRRVAIAMVTATAFSGFSTASALANTPIAALSAAPSHDGGLPTPVSLVLYTPGQGAPVAPQAPKAAPADVPQAIPAPGNAAIGKMILVLMAIIGVLVLVGLAVVAFAAWDLLTNNE